MAPRPCSTPSDPCASDRAALLEINLDRVTGLTDDAWRVLAASELPVEALAAAS